MSRWLVAFSLERGSPLALGWLLGVGAGACRGTSPPSDEDPATQRRGAPTAPDSPSSSGNGARTSSAAPSAPTGAAPLPGNDSSGSTDSPKARGPTAALPSGTASSDAAPQGCVGGAGAGRLALTLDAKLPVLELHAEGDTLFANGTACSDGAGHAILLSGLGELDVTGGAEDDSVTLDLGAGDWSGLFATPESVQIELGDGANGVLVRGTDGPDIFRHAMRGDDVVLDLSGAGNVDVVLSGLRTLGMSLGAGDDRLEDLAAFRLALASAATEQALATLRVPVFAAGGEGDDWLVGGSGDDQLDGGPGDDVLSGLDGDDVFIAGSEGDGNDVYNGGGGYDQLSYELRSTDLALFLCRSPVELGCGADPCTCSNASGNPGERDLILNIEELRAGSGNDLLRGSDASESLRGGPGNDTLLGGGGSDLLDGEQGNDVLDGGDDGDICDPSADPSIANCEL